MSKNTFAQFLDTVGTIKSAASTEDPGGADGPTEHPVKNEENHTQTAEEGSRNDEHEEDVKDQVGPASVDAAKEAMEGVNPPGNAADMQPQIGVKQAPTGEDPANETASTKATKDDASTGTAPGDQGYTEHPARTDNDSLDGMKYAKMNTRELNKLATDLGNSILRQLCSQPASTAVAAPAAQKSAAELNTQEAAELGWSLAGLVSENFDKQAADELVRNSLEKIVKTASDDADKVAEFCLHFQKAAMDEAAAAGAMGGGMPPEAAMAAGGMPPEAAMAAGGMPPEAAMAGGGSEEEQIVQLMMLLDQLGITPEQLAMMLEQGAPPAGGAPPATGSPMDAATMPSPDAGGMEVQASAKPKQNAAKSAQDVIKELLQRSK